MSHKISIGKAAKDMKIMFMGGLGGWPWGAGVGAAIYNYIYVGVFHKNCLSVSSKNIQQGKETPTNPKHIEPLVGPHSSLPITFC